MSDDDEKKRDDEKKKKKRDKPPPVERTVVTEHRVTIAGEEVAYRATAGTLFLRDDDDEPRAAVFYVAYTREGVDPAGRPVTFAFNGGPGSSAIWLQLGCLGPRRAEVPDLGAAPPPGRLVDNEDAILDATDLVFIDPVGTGFSRALGDTEAKAFHGVKEDVESVGEFIQRWLSRNGRWGSPRFLAGESYGTTRAAGLAAHLDQHGVVINGVVLVSAALMFQTLVFGTGNDLPYVLILPSYALAATFHGRVEDGRPAEERRADVERFCVEEYAPALMLGSALDDDRRAALAEQLAARTGVPASIWIRHDLRLDLSTFCRELLRDEAKIVGRMDCRFRGFLPKEGDDPDMEDPSLFYPYGAYTGLMNDYLRRELEYPEERRYEALSFTVNEGWKWRRDAPEDAFGYLQVGSDLRRAMVHNPHLHVLFVSGLYDLATPYFASMHTARHLGREPEIRDRVTEAFYDAGHMMYLHAPSRRKLREDLVAFYAAALRF